MIITRFPVFPSVIIVSGVMTGCSVRSTCILQLYLGWTKRYNIRLIEIL